MTYAAPCRIGAMLLLAANSLAAQPRSWTSPPGGDTTGYWQQRVHYQIVASLDEPRAAVRASARLWYVNQSPDTLRQLYFHQYLNAFRPASAWARADTREGRTRFQDLRDPDYAYERLTSAPLVDGTPVSAVYPLSPDSTIFWVPLGSLLLPGDSVEVVLEWEARPSTLPRRQGRRGRTYDFAQWYPKVAVYDRGGWQADPLLPAGEFYGEFGTYDVTFILPDDEIIASTGVPVSGDPGWERALRWGSVTLKRNAYGNIPPAPRATADSGMRIVRFFAPNVHHFAWSVSPDYRYEGGVYVRSSPARSLRAPVWDTVAIHVMYKPDDDSTWGKGQVVQRTQRALAWLEGVYGPYAYPQLTNIHRIEGGGTEFPMLMMNGSPSYGLILHEGGHIYTYGILANNERQSGWLDEGLTSYQTAWAQNLTPQERARITMPAPASSSGPTGYRALAERPAPADLSRLERYRVDLHGRAEPIGTHAHEFNEYSIYTAMVYTRAQAMYSALRDVMGDSSFKSFLRLYYDRWAMRHVDEAAMRRAAEDASGMDLRWFFDQWVRRVGLVDYSLKGVETRREGGEWVTSARVVKRGEYFHPMTLGVRTEDGWVTAKATDPMQWSQVVTVRTSREPLEVKLDPHGVSDDWYTPNDVPHVPGPFQVFGAVGRFDWPFLHQYRADRIVALFSPVVWYGKPGGYTPGLRIRTNYQGWINRTEFGIAVTTRQPSEPPNPSWTGLHVRHVDPLDRLQAWFTVDEPRLPWQPRPIVGLHMGAWALDGILKLDTRKTWDVSRFFYATGPERRLTAAYSGAYPIVHSMIDPARWSGLSTNEVSVGLDGVTSRHVYRYTLSAAAGYASGRPERDFSHDWYGRLDGAIYISSDTTTRFFSRMRIYGGWTRQAPIERSILRGARNSIETFANHYYRPAGSPLSRPVNHYVPIGGAGLRSDPFTVVEAVASANAELFMTLARVGPRTRPLAFLASAWSDATVEGHGSTGLGLVVRGHLFDRAVKLRVDFPLTSRNRVPWTFSTSDIW